MQLHESLAYTVLEALKSEQMHYTNVIQSVNFPIILLSSSKKIVSINPTMQSILDLNKQEASNECYSQLSQTYQSDIVCVNNQLQKLFPGKSVEMSQTFINSKNECYKICWQIHALKNSLYNKIHYILIGNITDAVRIEDKQKASLNEFKHVVEAIKKPPTERNHTELFHSNQYEALVKLLYQLPGCTYAKDKYYNYTDGNEYMIKNICGTLSKADLIGKNDYFLNQMIGARWPDQFYKDIHNDDFQVIEHNQPIINKIEKPFLSTDGFVILQSSTKIPIVDSIGDSIGLCGISIDISHKLSPIQLHSMYKMLYENKNDAQTTFLKHCYDIEKTSALSLLTSSELNCCLYLTLGVTVKEVAKSLNLSPRTVETHLMHAREKLNFLSKSELIQFFSTKRQTDENLFIVESEYGL